ncbi:MAG: L,D-transpeptidase family protein [Campylobacterales bacterium]|nr:L,D-transpeptidase family protein [Campylobacterales bacterium]
MKIKRDFIILSVLIQTIMLWANKEIIIDLSSQHAYALEDGNIVFDGRISSGKKGLETPNGSFRILEKQRDYVSNLWPKPNGGAKMPYMMRLSNDGIAMHLGYVPHWPDSHGCIRLQNGFAQKMYTWAQIGTPVVIDGDAADYATLRKAKNKVEDERYGIIDFHD